MLDFPNSPTTGQIFSSGKGTFSWDGVKWVPVFAGALGDAPSDGSLYGRQSAAWTKGVKLAGDTMTGPLVLNADPTAPLGAVTKQYVDAKSTTGVFLGLNSYSSSQTITIPAGATKAVVELWGATGGAGACNSNYNYLCVTGSTGAAGFLRKYLSGLTAGNTLALIIGAAGAGGTFSGTNIANNGGNGGASTLASGTQTISTLTANGTNGSLGNTNSNVTASTPGGTATGGDLNATGADGAAGWFDSGATNLVLRPLRGRTLYSYGADGTMTSTGNGNPGLVGGCNIWWYS
jgi:hypothetical protein